MTTSGFAATTARRTPSASKASATTARAPSASIIGDLAGDRVVPVTAWPASRSSLSSGCPITPLAPATKIFIAAVPIRSRHRRVHLGGVVILEILDRLAVGEAPGVGLGRRDHLAGLLVAPGAAAQHDDAVALGDEMLGRRTRSSPSRGRARRNTPSARRGCGSRSGIAPSGAPCASEPKAMLSAQIFIQSSTLPPLRVAPALVGVFQDFDIACFVRHCCLPGSDAPSSIRPQGARQAQCRKVTPRFSAAPAPRGSWRGGRPPPRAFRARPR